MEFLVKGENVAKMLAMAAIGEPPLLACAVGVEKLIKLHSNQKKDHLKRIAGLMVSVILDNYGYRPKKIVKGVY